MAQTGTGKKKIHYDVGETMSQNCVYQRTYSSPGWYVNVESHGDDYAGYKALITVTVLYSRAKYPEVLQPD
jgi:hypothetical protein